jgi:GTPase
MNGNQTARNQTAQTFRNLFATWQQDAASAKVDALAAELTAHIAQEGSSCVGLMQTSSIPKLFGLIYFLDGYGLLLRQRYRDQRDGVFIYIDRKNEVTSEFVGSVVRERVPVQEQASWPEFAKAA